MDQSKRKCGSRLPKIVKTSSKILKTPLHVCRTSKLGHKSNSKLEDTADPSGTNRKHRISKWKTDTDQAKRSNIPRPKINTKETTRLNALGTTTTPKLSSCAEPKNLGPLNVQQVQLLINTDFCTDDSRYQARSVTSSRPIPTLGQIYGRAEMTDSDRINDWIMTLNAPGVIPEVHQLTNLTEQSNHNLVESSTTQGARIYGKENCPVEIERSSSGTKFNNASDTFPTDLDIEYPTKDNESGYRSLSPLSNILISIKSKPSNGSQLQKNSPKNEYLRVGTDVRKSNTSLKENTDKSEASGSPTIVMTKVKPEAHKIQPKKISDTIKNQAVTSTMDTTKTLREMSKSPFLSFDDCISEILKKSTNFDGVLECNSPKTLSSLAVTDLEIHDNYSSEDNLDHTEDIFNDVSPKNSYQHLEDSSVFKTYSSQATKTINEFWSKQCFDGENLSESRKAKYSDKTLHGSVNRRKNESNCEARLRCKRSSSYRRFPSYRYNVFPFEALRKRVSMEILKRRWNCIWKKTAKRWTNFSKPSRRFHVMRYLQDSTFWEDIDVQTSFRIYMDSGTDSALKEQKSVAITTQHSTRSSDEPYWTSKFNTSNKDMYSCRSSKVRQGNLGPSLFLFADSNSSARSSNQKTNKFERRKSPISKNVETWSDNRRDINVNKTIPKNSCFIDDTAETIPSIQIQTANFNQPLSTTEICEVEVIDRDKEMCKKMLLTDNATSVTLLSNTLETLEATDVCTQIDINCNTKNAGKMSSCNKILKREASIRTPTNNYNLICTAPNLISISSRELSLSTDAIKRNYVHTEVSARPIEVASGGCMISPSLTECKCNYKPDVNTCWTSTSIMETNKLIPRDFEVYLGEREAAFGNKLTSSYTVGALSKKSQGSLICMDKELNLNNGEISTSTFTNIKSMKLRAKAISQVTSGIQANLSWKQSNTDYWNHNNNNTKNNEDESPCSTPIGRSRLLNVYTMSGAASEVATQTSCRFNVSEMYSYMTPKQWKSASVSMTGGYPTKVVKEIATNASFDEGHIVNCACAESNKNIGINTLIDRALSLECPTQTSESYLHNNCVQAGIHCTLACQRQLGAINDRLLSLTRILNQRKSNSHMHANCRHENVLSEDLNASKWINECTTLKKDYPIENSTPPNVEDFRISPISASAIATLPEELKKRLLNYKHHTNQRHDFKYVVEAAPALKLSRNKLVDVLKIHNHLQSDDINEETNSKMMFDDHTNKDITETFLQVSPENCDAATEWNPDYKTKSASVATSKIVLPSAKSCYQNNGSKRTFTDCLYVYDKPRCVVHKERTDVAIQKQPSSRDIELQLEVQDRNHSTSKLTAPQILPQCNQQDNSLNVLPPKVYKALYEATKLVHKDEKISKPLQTVTNSCAINTEPIVTLQFVTSRNKILSTDQSTEPDVMLESKIKKCRETCTQTCSNCRLQILEIPSEDQDDTNTHLVASCRYYSNLLTKKLGVVRENITKHFPVTEDYFCEISGLNFMEACTMKPSGRSSFGCQTKRLSNAKNRRHGSYFFLSPSSSLTEICRNDRQHLKSVYNMLGSIEGRVRRLKTNIPNSFE